MLNKRIFLSLIVFIILVTVGFNFLSMSKHGGNLYSISVNNPTYYSSWCTIDTTSNRVTFETSFGQTTSAPLDRTVITKY